MRVFIDEVLELFVKLLWLVFGVVGMLTIGYVSAIFLYGALM